MSIFDIHVRVQIVWRQELKVPKDCKLPTTPMVGICRVTLHCCVYRIRLIRWCSRHIHFPRLLGRISAPPIETHRNRRIPCHKLLTPKPISPVVNLSATPSLACPTALAFLLLWLPGFPELYLPSTRTNQLTRTAVTCTHLPCTNGGAYGDVTTQGVVGFGCGAGARINDEIGEIERSTGCESEALVRNCGAKKFCPSCGTRNLFR